MEAKQLRELISSLYDYAAELLDEEWKTIFGDSLEVGKDIVFSKLFGLEEYTEESISKALSKAYSQLLGLFRLLCPATKIDVVEGKFLLHVFLSSLECSQTGVLDSELQTLLKMAMGDSAKQKVKLAKELPFFVVYTFLHSSVLIPALMAVKDGLQVDDAKSKVRAALKGVGATKDSPIRAIDLKEVAKPSASTVESIRKSIVEYYEQLYSK